MLLRPKTRPASAWASRATVPIAMKALGRIGAFTAVAMLLIACQHKPAPGEEVSSACRVENDKKEISVSGYLQSPILVGCEKGTCSFQLTPKRDQKYDLRIEIPLGSGPGTMTPLSPSKQESMPGHTFVERVTVDIRDSNGSNVSLGDVIRVTGIMHAYASTDGTMQCRLEVKKFVSL